MGSRLALVLSASLLAVLTACSDQNLRAKIDDQQREIEALQRENVALRSQTEAARPAARTAAQADSDKSAGSVKELSAAPEIKKAGIVMTSKGPREIAFVISADHVFVSRSVKVSKEGSAKLDLVANHIQKNFPGAAIRVEGHTDSDPIKALKDKYSSNQELSAARAGSVKEYLEKKLNLESSRIESTGLGDTQPLDPKDKKKNRRVEIVVIQ